MKERLLNILFTVCFILLNIINVNAVSIKSVKSTNGYVYGPDMKVINYKKSMNELEETIKAKNYTFSDDLGNNYYCVQPFIIFHDGEYLKTKLTAIIDNNTSANINVNKLKLIMYFGAGYNNRTEDYWYILTRILLWRELFPNGNFNFVDEDNRIINDYDDYIGNINKDINNYYIYPSFKGISLYDKQEETSLILNDKNNIINTFSIESCINCKAKIENNKLIIDYINIGDFKVNLIRKYERFTDNEINLFSNANNPSQLLINGANPEPNIFSINGSYIPKDGNLVVHKVDAETKKSLSGVEICLYNLDYEELSCNKTNRSGNARFLSIRRGDYYIKEKSTLDNYEIDNNFYKITIDGNKNETLFELKNKRKTDIIIHKIDVDTKKPLNGVEICLYNLDYEELSCNKTNRNGKVNFSSLNRGRYYIKEKSTLEYYELDSNFYELDANKNEINFELVNKKKSRIIITKIDDETKEKLSDVTIALFNELDELLTISKTDKEGKIEFNGLSKGKYYIKEINTVDGYVLDDNKYYFDIELSNSIELTKILTNRKTSIKIIKYNKKTKKTIPNVLIGIYRKENNNYKKVLEKYTDDFGIIKVIGLRYGEYYYQEENIVPGYEVNNNKYYFEVNNMTSDDNFEIYNNPLKSITIIKKDFITEKVISGAEICLYDMVNNEVCKETDEEGKVVFTNLKSGIYSYYEKTAPNGYILDNERYECTLSDNIILNYYNKKEVIEVPNTYVEIPSLNVLIYFVLGLRKLFK